MTNDLHELLEEYRADLGSLNRFYSLSGSPLRATRFARFYADWGARLDELNFADLGPAARADYVLFRNQLGFERRRLELAGEVRARLREWLPFADRIIELEEARVRKERVDPAKVASTVHTLAGEVGEPKGAPEFGALALESLGELRGAFRGWFEHYEAFDPLFSWWVGEPFRAADAKLEAFEAHLKGQVGGALTGRPVGRDALEADLAFEMIPYSPEELIALGEREYAWCEAEMIRASRELGFGDAWRDALEHVKTTHVPPGSQPELVRELAVEAIEFVESRDLLTVPELAKETWRLEMMSAERQLVNPFFLGGEAIIVSYPTSGMSHDRKRMSMRGNNPHFSRATVQHELIPGHHLQMYMLERYRPYRQVFSTPFWIEGWALYWEMRLWDLDFPRGPEDRIGMLFWRMHRCVRVSFSLRFHLGELTPQECVEMLVDRVGHERANAEGEVRRSFNGSYPPLYQAAYLIGGLQMRALWRELVGSGRMTDRAFHDAVLRENEMPIRVLRAILGGEEISASAIEEWRFEG